MPAAGANGQILLQDNSGHEADKVAEKIATSQALFRLGVPRSQPLRRAVAQVHEGDRTDAVDYPDAQVARRPRACLLAAAHGGDRPPGVLRRSRPVGGPTLALLVRRRQGPGTADGSQPA
ncbi:hypothetical protein [Kitasatospora sp. NBC_01302]|uniref:hypothetical protein n=1 Tax=Kitasatospora sp. NBC_01302 TaxID=2903575 RepID=UPI002E11F9D9|nr:hypothetical protein OG294_40360 [Kitasatospora sp. NBC_01302]